MVSQDLAEFNNKRAKYAVTQVKKKLCQDNIHVVSYSLQVRNFNSMLNKKKDVKI